MKRCPDVSHPSSLSHKHTLKPLCQESSGMFRAYVPDSFSQPRLLWRRNTHSHPGAETETVEEAWSSPRAGAWADAAWHAQKQSSVFLRRYVKHPVSGLTCFLFEGCTESRCDAPPGQCQPESVWEGGRKEGRGRPGRNGSLLLYCIAAGNQCSFSQILIILFSRSNLLYCWHMADCPKHWPLLLIQTIVELNII